MPRYEYLCPVCRHLFEVRQSFSSEPVANCPVCSSGARRVIHAVPVVFKGGGWFVNDYGKRASSSVSSPDKEPSTDGASKEKAVAEAGKSEAKAKEPTSAKAADD